MTDEEKATEIKIAILLDKIKLQSQRLNELTKENAELEKDKEYLDKVNNEQTEVILKLQAQIKKNEIS